MSNGSGKNRHGVKTYPENRPPRCIWPQCGAPVTRFEPTKLCNQHAIIVWEQVDPTEAAYRRAGRENIRRLPEDVENVRRQRREDEAALAAAVEAAKPKPSVSAGPGHVYYVRNDAYIKIGWTSNLAKRMRAYPPGSRLLAVEPGTRDDELRLHKRFAVHRSHGREWYPLTPVLIAHIDRVVEQHGVPDDVAFGARPVTVPQPRAKQYPNARDAPHRVA